MQRLQQPEEPINHAEWDNDLKKVLTSMIPDSTNTPCNDEGEGSEECLNEAVCCVSIISDQLDKVVRTNSFHCIEVRQLCGKRTTTSWPAKVF